jgi:hypothetical protein
MEHEAQLRADIGAMSSDPLAYVKYAFPWHRDGELEQSDGPRAWQRDILETIGQHLRGPNRFQPLRIAVSSGHGIGKSALIGQVIEWAMSTCEDCRVALTANTEAQLRTKTWPEVSKWFRLAINAHWWNVTATSITVKERAHERVWRADAIAWSENNTEAFAGLHNKGKRIVVIYDEASAIADRLWEVTQGALTDEETEIIWLAFGNPTQNTGRFKECFGRYRHRWVTKQIDSRTVDGTNKAQLDQWIEDYGEDSDFCRVRVRGEFPRAGASQFISGEIVADARRRNATDYGHHWKVLSVDVARFGDDQTVIGLRQGPKLTVLDKLRGEDTVQVAQRTMFHMKQHVPRLTVVDGDGIGAGVVDIVRADMKEWFARQKPCVLYEFHGGGSPKDGQMYFNQRAEVWGMMREWLKTGDIPNDPELETDLTGPQYFFSNKNQIQMEKKEDMKKRGLASPDIGDMLAMTFATVPHAKTHDEKLSEQIAAVEERDPMEAHFMRLRETERRNRAHKPRNYWE